MKSISKAVTFACVLSTLALTGIAGMKSDVKMISKTVALEEKSDVEVIARFIAFPKEKINEIVTEDITKPLTVDDLSTLLKNGHGRIISSPRVITKSGNQAIVRSAVIYRAPQDFDVEAASTKSTNATPFAVIKPQDWEDFDIGATISVTPVVADDETRINVNVEPRLTGDMEWETIQMDFLGFDSAKTGVDFVLPRIKTLNCKTCLTMQNGSTVIVTGGMSDREEEEEIFVLLTCTVLNPASSK